MGPAPRAINLMVTSPPAVTLLATSIQHPPRDGDPSHDRRAGRFWSLPRRGFSHNITSPRGRSPGKRPVTGSGSATVSRGAAALELDHGPRRPSTMARAEVACELQPPRSHRPRSPCMSRCSGRASTARRFPPGSGCQTRQAADHVAGGRRIKRRKIVALSPHRALREGIAADDPLKLALRQPCRLQVPDGGGPIPREPGPARGWSRGNGLPDREQAQVPALPGATPWRTCLQKIPTVRYSSSLGMRGREALRGRAPNRLIGKRSNRRVPLHPVVAGRGFAESGQGDNGRVLMALVAVVEDTVLRRAVKKKPRSGMSKSGGIFPFPSNPGLPELGRLVRIFGSAVARHTQRRPGRPPRRSRAPRSRNRSCRARFPWPRRRGAAPQRRGRSASLPRPPPQGIGRRAGIDALQDAAGRKFRRRQPQSSRPPCSRRAVTSSSSPMMPLVLRLMQPAPFRKPSPKRSSGPIEPPPRLLEDAREKLGVVRPDGIGNHPRTNLVP